MLVIIGVLAQHVNLFQMDLGDYNFRLIFYIIVLQLLPLLKKVQNFYQLSNHSKHVGINSYVGIIRKLLQIVIIYDLLTIYDEYTKLKVIILSYYFFQKLITKTFADKRYFLSIKKDIRNYFITSKINRTAH